MTCQLTFLPVGNADSIVIKTDNSTIIVDLGKPDVLEEWLKTHEILKIDRIYITHAHGDHFPSLAKLVDFVEECRNNIDIKKIHFPCKALEAAWKKVQSDRQKNRRLEDILVRIEQWSRQRDIIHSPIFRDGEDYSEGALKIEALHPSEVFGGKKLAESERKLNEISTVLRVDYSKFSAILLADIEGEGLTELLSFLKVNSKCYDFTTNVVKIPHHGAWPSNGDDLNELLELIDAEIAVLSVGSKNKYGHVKPELFNALIKLKNKNNKRMSKFICTEVTRTCVKSASEQSKMKKSGLPQQKLCAGEITILAETSGQWKFANEIEHQNIIDDLEYVKYAACQDRLNTSNKEQL